jgi:hypothetical protein
MQVRERPRRHRGRRTAIGVAALVGILTTTAACADTADESSQPAGSARATPSHRPSGSAAPSPTPSPPPDADTIIRTGHLYSYAPGVAGSVLTVWQTCTDDEVRVCHSAWQVQAAGGTHRGLVAGDSPGAYTAGDAFVVKAWNSRGAVVATDGTVTPLVEGAPRPVTSGDALLSGRKGLLVVDPRTARTWPLPRENGVDRWDRGTVAEDGTAWASAAVGGQVWLGWNRGGSWRHHVMLADQPRSLPGYVAVAGDHVASISGYDGATILPVADLAVTTDGGATWRDLHQRDLPFTYVDAMAATSGGTLYVVTAGAEHLFRSTGTTWTRFTEVPNPHRLDVLVPAGDRVLAQGGTYDNPELFALDDSGHATPVPLTR